MSERQTKADLLAVIEKAEVANAALRDDLNRLRAERSADAEAAAIDACVKALDRLKRAAVGGGYSSGYRFKRVLKYLADRYGVDWYEPPPQPADFFVRSES